jgi:hypothetical protein
VKRFLKYLHYIELLTVSYFLLGIIYTVFIASYPTIASTNMTRKMDILDISYSMGLLFLLFYNSVYLLMRYQNSNKLSKSSKLFLESMTHAIYFILFITIGFQQFQQTIMFQVYEFYIDYFSIYKVYLPEIDYFLVFNNYLISFILVIFLSISYLIFYRLKVPMKHVETEDILSD